MKHLTTIILLTLLMTACERDEKEFIKKNKSSILSVFVKTPELEADGKSMMEITAMLSHDADNKTVIFSTNSGNFLDSSTNYTTTAVMQNDSLLAHAWLVSSLVPNDFVTVKVSVPKIDTTVHFRFINAKADSIRLESTVASIKQGFDSQIPLQTYLVRTIGTPSLHQSVTFGAFKKDNTPIGDFRGIDVHGSNADGLINATFILKDTLYRDTLKIVTRYEGKTKLLTDTLITFVTK